MDFEPAPLLVEHLTPARRSLRLAVVTETYPPEVNGVALTAARFVEELRRRHHAIQLIRPRQAADESSRVPGPPWDTLTRGVPLPRYPSLRLGLPARRMLVRAWTAQRPDVVHVVTEGPLGWSALQAARHLRLPVVSDFRTNFHAYSGHYGAGWLRKPILAYLRKFHNRTLVTFVPTAGLRDQLLAQGFARVEVVSRGVDTERFDPARRDRVLRAAWGAGDATPVVLHVGRLAPEKNLDLVVRAFHEIARANPGTRLVLVGDGPERTRLAAQLPGAVFAGTRTGEELAAHFASADLFLFPSLSETYGNVVVEAMASGLPVVAFDCAAAGEHVRCGVNGLLAPPADLDGFVRRALDLAADPALGRRLGLAARRTALTLGWERVALGLERLLLAAACAGTARGGARLPGLEVAVEGATLP